MLNSINSKDKLYKRLVQTPKDSLIYADLLSNFKIYKSIIQRSIMHAKRDYYRNVFHKHSSNLEKNCQIINESLNRWKGRRNFPQEFQLTFQPITVDITSRIIDSLKPKTSTGVDCIAKICEKCHFRTINYNY